MFLLSLVLVIAAILMALAGRGQLEQGFRAWQGGNRVLLSEFSHRAAWCLYPAWFLAIAGAACLIISRRRRETGWRWTVMVLLGLFLLFSCSPI